MRSRIASPFAFAFGVAWPKKSTAGALVLAGLISSNIARADDSPTTTPSEPARHLTWQVAPPEAQTGGATAPVAPRRYAEQRPFAFLLDPSTPSARDVGVSYDLGAGSAGSAERPLPSSLGVAGVTHAFTVDYGWGPQVAPFATLRVVQPTNSHVQAGVGATGGVRWQLTDPTGPFHLTVAAAAFRETEGTFGTYARVAASYDFGRLRVAGNVHGERAFAAGRDSVDILVLAGMSYLLFEELRVGVEYVGQDLEEEFDAEGGAEGGAKHYMGPSLALNLLSDKLQLVAGTGVNLAAPNSGPVGRVGTLMMF